MARTVALARLCRTAEWWRGCQERTSAVVPPVGQGNGSEQRQKEQRSKQLTWTGVVWRQTDRQTAAADVEAQRPVTG